MTPKLIALPFALGVLLLQGCSNPQAPSASNFEAAFEEHLKTAEPSETQLCYAIGHYKEEREAITFTSSSGPDDELVAYHNVLVDAGLFEPATQEEANRYYKATSYTYPITKKGKDILQTEEVQGFLGAGVKGHYLCVGKVKLDKVVKWTEPAQQMGMNMAVVTYRLRYTGLPEWTSEQVVVANFKHLAERAAGPHEVEAQVVLTNVGWEIVK